MKLKLGVNIDHIATLRQVRKAQYPNLIEAIHLALKGGADGITIHLREDRRHIQTQDLIDIVNAKVYLNLEIAPNSEVVNLALKYKPHECCLVPEKREELTTEGGLDLLNQFKTIKQVTRTLQENGTKVSLFIDPIKQSIDLAKQLGADCIEIHTGEYANAQNKNQIQNELMRIEKITNYAKSLDLIVNAGHGLTLSNVSNIARIESLSWLNIGHFIVANSVFFGLEKSVALMVEKIKQARKEV